MDCGNSVSYFNDCHFENSIDETIGGSWWRRKRCRYSAVGKRKRYEVFVSDAGKIAKKYKDVLRHNEIEWEDEGHTESKILNADYG